MSATTTDSSVELRLVVPRSALPAPPVEYFSQLNCQLLGLGRRQFLELLRRSGAPPVTRVGKTRLVRRDDMIDFLDRIRRGAEERAGKHEDLDDADRVLMEMGCAPKQRSA